MKKGLILLLSVLGLLSLASCGKEKAPNIETDVEPIIIEEGKRNIKDISNREVTLPKEIRRVCCIGSGTMRLYSYVADINYICAVERVENFKEMVANRTPLRPYYEVNKEYFSKLPLCGMGGRGETVPNSEELLMAKPDLIFSSHSVEAVNNLQNQINVPVVRVFYKTNDIKDPSLFASIKLIGSIMNASTRAEALIKYMEAAMLEINQKTLNKESTPIYYGCNSHSGQRGIQSTVAGYSTFEIANIKNIIDPLEPEGSKKPNYYHEFDLEQLKKLDPKKIIIDGGGIQKLKEDFSIAKNKNILESISAFKNDEVYVQLPCNAYQTNIEMALINCYYCASVAYPEVFSKEDIKNKTKEITEMFLGKDLTDLLLARVPDSLNKLDLSKIY